MPAQHEPRRSAAQRPPGNASADRPGHAAVSTRRRLSRWRRGKWLLAGFALAATVSLGATSLDAPNASAATSPAECNLAELELRNDTVAMSSLMGYVDWQAGVLESNLTNATGERAAWNLDDAQRRFNYMAVELSNDRYFAMATCGLTPAIQPVLDKAVEMRNKITNTLNRVLPKSADAIIREPDGFDPCNPAQFHAGAFAGSAAAALQAAPPSPVVVSLSRSRYPESARHIEDAVRAGKPKILTIARDRCVANRRASMQPHKGLKAPGMDRDEYPFAMSAQGGAGASVRLIPASDNRGAGSTIGSALRPYPNGTQFTINIVP